MKRWHNSLGLPVCTIKSLESLHVLQSWFVFENRCKGKILIFLLKLGGCYSARASHFVVNLTGFDWIKERNCWLRNKNLVHLTVFCCDDLLGCQGCVWSWPGFRRNFEPRWGIKEFWQQPFAGAKARMSGCQSRQLLPADLDGSPPVQSAMQGRLRTAEGCFSPGETIRWSSRHVIRRTPRVSHDQAGDVVPEPSQTERARWVNPTSARRPGWNGCAQGWILRPGL